MILLLVLFNSLPLGSSLPFLFVVVDDDTIGATLGAVVTTLDGDTLVVVEVILILDIAGGGVLASFLGGT